MKLSSKLIVFTALGNVLVGPLSADNGIPPDRITFLSGANDTRNADWFGIYGRSYFIQWSVDLQAWSYASFVDFSDGLHRRGMKSSTPKFFIRHILTDAPTTDPELEDFAGDGIGSLIKLKMGLDPFAPLAWVDVDGDGIHDAIEQFWFGSLTGTEGDEDDANGNGIRDIFELQAGNDPTTDLTGDTDKRSNFTYDNMGRLTEVDDVTFAFDIEGNLESSN
jgi:hypothetical protein